MTEVQLILSFIIYRINDSCLVTQPTNNLAIAVDVVNQVKGLSNGNNTAIKQLAIVVIVHRYLTMYIFAI